MRMRLRMRIRREWDEDEMRMRLGWVEDEIRMSWGWDWKEFAYSNAVTNKYIKLSIQLFRFKIWPMSNYQYSSSWYHTCPLWMKCMPLDLQVCQKCRSVWKKTRPSRQSIDTMKCWIYIPCPLSLRLLGSIRGSLGKYGLTQKLYWKKITKKQLFNRFQQSL